MASARTIDRRLRKEISGMAGIVDEISKAEGEVTIITKLVPVSMSPEEFNTRLRIITSHIRGKGEEFADRQDTALQLHAKLVTLQKSSETSSMKLREQTEVLLAALRYIIPKMESLSRTCDEVAAIAPAVEPSLSPFADAVRSLAAAFRDGLGSFEVSSWALGQD